MNGRFLYTSLPRLHGGKLKLQFCSRHLSQEAQPQKPNRQVPREKPAVRRRGLYGKGYPLLMIPITAFGLGTWQIQRREWKLKLIKELEDKMKEPPVPLPENLEDVSNMEYRKVKLKGTFDHSKELFIGPRSDIRAFEDWGRRREPASGVNVITPFKLADRDETILVNRGFVPFSHRPSNLRHEGQVEDEVEITGVIRLNDENRFVKSNPLKDGYWAIRNIDEMAAIAGTAKVFVDADANSTVPGGPLGGQTRISLRNEHLTYIVTWYALAAFTFYLWYRNYRRPYTHKTVLEYVKKGHTKM